MAATNTSCLQYLNMTIANLTNATSCDNNSPPKQPPIALPLCQMSQDRSIYPLLLMCFIAVLENAFTCYIIYANKILHTATNIFVFSLCIADGLCAGVLLPVAVFCKNSLLYGFLAVIIVFTYCANLSAVTYERLISITKPLRYYSLITKRVAFKIAILAWVIPTCFSLLPLIWKGDQKRKEHKVYMIISLLVFLVAPFFFICFVYTRISIEVHRLLKSSRSLQVFSYDNDERRRKPFSVKFKKLSCFTKAHEQPSARKERISSDVDDKTVVEDLSPDFSECGKLCRKTVRIRNESLNSGPNNNLFKRSSSDKDFPEQDEKQQVSANDRQIERTAEEGSLKNFNDCKPDNAFHDINQAENEVSISPDQDQDIKNSPSCIKTDTESQMNNIGPDRPGKSTLTRTDTEITYLERDSRSFSVPASPKNEPIQEEIEPEAPVNSIQDGGNETTEILGMNNERQNGHARTEQAAPSERNSTSKQVNMEESCNLITTENELNNENITGQKKRKSIVGRIKRLYSKRDSNLSSGIDNSARRRSRAVRIKNVLDEVRASTAFAAVAITYMFTWIPVIYMTFMEVIGKLHEVPVKSMTEVNTWTIAANAAVDPLFYALFLRNFRKTVKKHFKRMGSHCS